MTDKAQKKRKQTPIEASQKSMEQLMRMQKDFDASPEHVIVTDKKGKIIYANKAAEDCTGYSLAEAFGKTPGELWGGKMPKEFYEKMWKTIKVDKQPFVGKVRNIRKDGTEYLQELYISPVLDDNGEVHYFIGIEPKIADETRRDRFVKKILHAHKAKSSNNK